VKKTILVLTIVAMILTMAACGKAAEKTAPSATPAPTATPTAKPTATPTAKPTATPTAKPTATPEPEVTVVPVPVPVVTEVPVPVVTVVPVPVVTEVPVPAPQTAVVKPLSNTVDSNNCTVRAAFTASDLTNIGSGLSLNIEIFDVVLYDAVEVSSLNIGSKIVNEQGKEITVESIVDENGTRKINGGNEKGGLSLVPGEGGTYTLGTSTDYKVMTSLGKQVFPVSSNCVIVDNSDPAKPNVTVPLSDFEAFLKNDSKKFNQYNTVVTVENGNITRIERNYMP